MSKSSSFNSGEQKSLLFELSRKNYLQNSNIWKMQPERKYIYVLFFNVLSKKAKPLPFYVGQTNNLSTRFASHAELIWHHAKFGSKAVVHVIAAVPDFLADEAEGETVEMLLSYQYRLNNISLNETLRTKPKNMTLPALQRYMQDFLTYAEQPFQDFTKLQLQWAKKESENKASYNKINGEQGLATPSDLYRAVTNRKYPNSQAHGLSKALAKAYNVQAAVSVYVFRSSSGKEESHQLKLIEQTMKELQGDWKLVGPLLVDVPLIFKPAPDLHTIKSKEILYGRRPVHKSEIISFENTQKGSPVKPVVGKQLPDIDLFLYSEKVSPAKRKQIVRDPASIVQVVRGLIYKKPESSRISQSLALSFNPELGEAAYTLGRSQHAPRIQTVEHALKEISEHWEMVTPLSTFETKQKLIFKPTDLLRSMVEAHGQ